MHFCVSLPHGCSTTELLFRKYTPLSILNFISVRGMASEEAKLQYVTITQKLVGYGDEYYPAKVDTIMYNMSQSSVWAFWTTRSWL